MLLRVSEAIRPAAGSGDDFTGPDIENEFFPKGVLFVDTIFELNRVMLIRILVTVLLIIVFTILANRFRKSTLTGQYVPGRFQMLGEMGINFVRKNIAHEQLGEKDGDRFLPLLVTIFFTVIGMNITGVVPALNLAGTSVIGLPLVMALAAYVTFIYAGVKKHRMTFFKTALFPSGVPKALYIMLTPIELVSTFVLRPVTLALRLTMNMIAGHLLLVLCFTSTHFFLFNVDGPFKAMAAGTLLFGFAFTLLEIFISMLQAYVFTLLTTVYIQLSLADEH
jgi:F-type H+-transporting ATPase subunit a